METYMEQQPTDKHRFERKYFLGLDKNYIFKSFLIQNGYINSYDSRYVTSIYYDTDKFKYFKTNVDGLAKRLKVRIRWYNKEVQKKVVEYKIKNGFLGKKMYFDYLNENDMIHKTIKITGDTIRPIVEINYLREYFLSPCKKFRATIDNRINARIKNFQNIKLNKVYFDQSILEFKYERKNDEFFRKFVNKVEFPFRFKKNSKYVTSLLLLKNF